jgi:glycosyltransferase involved in cell wall biosynthesis
MASAAPPDIWVLGTIPPPVTGMTLLTEQVVRGLQRAGPITFLNWSPGMQRRGLRFRFRRVTRAIASVGRLLAHGRVRNSRLYLTANSSRGGLVLTGIVVAVAVRLGHRVYLHHHTYAHIDGYDWRMAWIDRTMGRRGVHVVHAQQMIDDFRARYPTQCGFEVVYPSIVAVELGQPKDAPGTPFRLGHLGNLMPAKGLHVVLETFETLRSKGCNVCLKLAGPFHTREAKAVVERAVDRHGGLVQYEGPLYGQAKRRFFTEIDAFLFPSRSESWGIVLHEAMAAGTPVIANDRGCVRTAVGDRAGLVVARGEDFLSLAVPQIQRWMADGDLYRAASQAAIDQAAYLHEQGKRTLEAFVAHMFSAGDVEADEGPA